MKNIKVYTSTVKVVSYFLIPLSIVGLVVSWLVPSGSYLSLSRMFVHPDHINQIASMPVSHRLLAMAVDGISHAFIIAALLLIIALMNRLERGEFFSPTIASLVMRLSTALFFWALYTPVNRVLLSVITTFHNPPGQRVLAVTLGSGDLFNILFFCLLMIVVAVVQKGSSLQQDQDLTV